MGITVYLKIDCMVDQYWMAWCMSWEAMMESNTLFSGALRPAGGALGGGTADGRGEECFSNGDAVRVSLRNGWSE